MQPCHSNETFWYFLSFAPGSSCHELGTQFTSEGLSGWLSPWGTWTWILTVNWVLRWSAGGLDLQSYTIVVLFCLKRYLTHFRCKAPAGQPVGYSPKLAGNVRVAENHREKLIFAGGHHLMLRLTMGQVGRQGDDVLDRLLRSSAVLKVLEYIENLSQKLGRSTLLPLESLWFWIFVPIHGRIQSKAMLLKQKLQHLRTFRAPETVWPFLCRPCDPLWLFLPTWSV